MQVKEIMTKKVITAEPGMSLRKLTQIFLKKNISAVPVVDKRGKLLGIAREEGLIFKDKKVHLPTFISLSVGFIALGTGRFKDEMRKIAASKVADIMEKDIVIIPAYTTIEDAATMMIEKNIYYMLVADGKKKLLGVVTKRDIVRAIAKGLR